MQVSESITRKSASNLALAFVLLPRQKRQEMSTLYAFCREVDDVADEETATVDDRRARLTAWRDDLRLGYEQRPCQMAVNRELQPIVAKYQLPFQLFDELLRGVEMDLDTQRYQTYEELELYCYRVASVVGLLSIEIFGYRDAACKDYAIYLGKALQLTNILRDVRRDAERGRIYLPLSELTRFRVRPEEILSFEYSSRFFDLARDVAAHARRFYQLARQTLPAVDRRSMATAELMGSVYWRLLRKLERRRFDVFGPTLTRLSKGQKLLLIIRTWCRRSAGVLEPNYGTP